MSREDSNQPAHRHGLIKVFAIYHCQSRLIGVFAGRTWCNADFLRNSCFHFPFFQFVRSHFVFFSSFYVHCIWLVKFKNLHFCRWSLQPYCQWQSSAIFILNVIRWNGSNLDTCQLSHKRRETTPYFYLNRCMLNILCVSDNLCFHSNNSAEPFYTNSEKLGSSWTCASIQYDQCFHGLLTQFMYIWNL